MAINHDTYAAMSEHEIRAFQAKVWNTLAWATDDDLDNGRMEALHTVAPIVGQLPSARRYEKNTDNALGWRGGKAVSVVVLSIEDEARVGSLLRAWQRG